MVPQDLPASGVTRPYSDDGGRRVQAGLLVIGAVISVASYPVDTFLSTYPETIELRLGWSLSFLAAAAITLRGNPLMVQATNHLIAAGSVLALFSLIHMTGGAQSLHLDWLLAFPVMAALMAPEDPPATLATSVLLLLGAPLLMSEWGLPRAEILSREIALVFSSGVALAGVMRRRKLQLDRIEALREQARLQELNARDEEKHRAAERALHSERLATVGTLMAGTAHDINNILHALNLNLGLLEDEGVSVKESREATALIGMLVSDLMLAARMSPGVVGASLPEVLATAARLSRGRRQSHQLKIHNPPSLPLTRAEKAPLILLFVNLIVNAADAMGSTPGTITVTTSARPDGIRVTVDDQGPGIPDNIRAQIFDPFFTTKPEGEGTGLGLSLVRDYLVQIGGQIGVTTPPSGQGARFWILLPLHEGSDFTDPRVLIRP